MLATSSPFQIMVEGVQQTYHFKVGMTLPGGIYPDVSMAVSSVSTASQMTTDLPDGTRLLEGYPSATASFTLAGLVDKTDASKTAAWLFGPYSTTSPLYRSDAFRAPVTIDLGLVPDGAGGTAEVLRKFTGYVDSYTVNSDGSVDFTCLDLRSDLRNIVTLPSVVTIPPYNAGLTSEFAVDALLRQSTGGVVSSWPKQRPGCILAVGLRSSLWAEVGSLLTTVSQPIPAFAASAYGSGLLASDSTAASTTLAANTWSLAGPATTDIYVEFLAAGLDTGQASATVGRLRGASGAGTNFVRGVTILSNGTQVALQLDGTTVAVIAGAPSAGPHKLAAAVKYTGTSSAGTFSGTLWVDSAAATFSVALRDNDQYLYASPTNAQVATVGGFGAGVPAGLQVTTEASPTPGTFTPRAVLDLSKNPLQLIPPTTGDPFQVIQQIAAAELAVAGFDEAGVFRFYNRDRLRASASVRTISSTTSLMDLGVESTAASVVNRAQISYTPWVFATTSSTIYSIDAVKKIPKRSSQPIIVNLETAVFNPDTTVVKLPNGSTNTTDSFYRASIDAAGVTEHPGPLTFTVTQPGANTITITVTNGSNADAYLVSPSNYTDIAAGTPVLRIGGFLVLPDTELTADYQYPPVGGGGAAASRFGEVPFSLSGNQWLQNDDAANLLALDVVGNSSQPIPNLTNVTILPDPRLQIADRVRIVDPDVSGVDDYAQIFSVSTALTANDDGGADYSMNVDARTITRPGGWILGVTGRSELGVTTWI